MKIFKKLSLKKTAHLEVSFRPLKSQARSKNLKNAFGTNSERIIFLRECQIFVLDVSVISPRTAMFLLRMRNCPEYVPNVLRENTYCL